MDYISLGKTKLLISKTAFGAESLNCKEINSYGDEAISKVCAIVHQAYSGGINFFDTSHSCAECEKRLGTALKGIRQNVFLATKTTAKNLCDFRSDLDSSLENLHTKMIDLYQLENPSFIPRPNGADGIYNELLTLRDKRIIKHFGIATTDLDLAREAIHSDLFEVVQFPFNMISTEETLELVKMCDENDTGCIAMQPLNGGLITDVSLALGFFQLYENVVPVFGVHTQEELKQIQYFNDHPPVLDFDFLSEIEKTRAFFN